MKIALDAQSADLVLLREESAKINEELLSDNDRLEQLVDEQTQLV